MIRRRTFKGRRADDYEVGYGKPPEHSRFKPGHSGNPKGRPKGVRNFKTDVQAALTKSVRVTREGKPHRVSTQLATLLRLREKALGGDSRAIDGLLTLARLYNNDDSLEVPCLSRNDAELLAFYNARVLRGAAVTPTPASDSGQANHAMSEADQATPTRKRKVKRIRLRRIKP